MLHVKPKVPFNSFSITWFLTGSFTSGWAEICRSMLLKWTRHLLMEVWPWLLFLLAGQRRAAENPSVVQAPVFRLVSLQPVLFHSKAVGRGGGVCLLADDRRRMGRRGAEASKQGFCTEKSLPRPRAGVQLYLTANAVTFSNAWIRISPCFQHNLIGSCFCGYLETVLCSNLDLFRSEGKGIFWKH